MKGYWHTSLFIFIFNGTVQYSNSQTAGLTCVSDFETSISCVWWNSPDFTNQRCVLVGKCDSCFGFSTSCELVPLTNQPHFRRSCSLSIDKNYFFYLMNLRLDVTCNGSAISEQNFIPAQNIKTQPPDMPTVQGDNITWSRGSNFPEALKYVEFQLQVKALHASWEATELRSPIRETYVQLDHNKLTVGEEYQARVRVKPVETQDGYKGQWSDWSPAASWRSEIGRQLEKSGVSPQVPDGIHIVLITGFSIFLLFTCLCFVVCKAKKSKPSIETNNQHVPDPSKYFQPLHSVHGGNFRKWLGCQNSVGPFLTPQSCDVISPVEVTDFWDMSLIDPRSQMTTAAFIHSSQVDSGLENSGTSRASSSIFSNMGYFYSKSNRGSLYFESCPVYFSYHPKEATSSSVSSAGSYDCLQSPSFKTDQPMSPDSGFSMPGEGLCEDDQGDDSCGGAERCAAEGQALISFIMSLSQGSHSAARPAESLAPVATITPSSEPMRANSYTSSSEPAEGAMVRPSSMIEPCGSGYLTLKEMQKYSNKSI